MKYKQTIYVLIMCCFLGGTLINCNYSQMDNAINTIQTQCYYPEKWETVNPPEKHIEIVQFYNRDECDTWPLLQNTIKSILETTYKKETEEGKIIYHGVETNYIENLAIRQEFFAMEEDLYESIFIEGNYILKNRWLDIFLAAEDNPESLKEKIQEKIDISLKQLSEYQEK